MVNLPGQELGAWRFRKPPDIDTYVPSPYRPEVQKSILRERSKSAGYVPPSIKQPSRLPSRPAPVRSVKADIQTQTFSGLTFDPSTISPPTIDTPKTPISVKRQMLVEGDTNLDKQVKELEQKHKSLEEKGQILATTLGGLEFIPDSPGGQVTIRFDEDKSNLVVEGGRVRSEDKTSFDKIRTDYEETYRQTRQQQVLLESKIKKEQEKIPDRRSPDRRREELNIPGGRMRLLLEEAPPKMYEGVRSGVSSIVDIAPDFNVPLVGSERFDKDFVTGTITDVALMPLGIATLIGQSILDPVRAPKTLLGAGIATGQRFIEKPIQTTLTFGLAGKTWGKVLGTKKTIEKQLQTEIDITKARVGVKITPGEIKIPEGKIGIDRIDLFGKIQKASSKDPLVTDLKAGLRIQPSDIEAGYVISKLKPTTQATTVPTSFIDRGFFVTSKGDVILTLGGQLVKSKTFEVPALFPLRPTKTQSLQAELNALKFETQKFLSDQRGELGQAITEPRIISAPKNIVDSIRVPTFKSIPLISPVTDVVIESDIEFDSTISSFKPSIPSFKPIEIKETITEEEDIIEFVPIPYIVSKPDIIADYTTKPRRPTPTIPKITPITETVIDFEEAKIQIPDIITPEITIPRFDTPKPPKIKKLEIDIFKNLKPKSPKPLSFFPRTQTKKQIRRTLFVPGFDVFVKKTGKFIKITDRPLTRLTALSRGARKVADTPARTFKIKPATLIPKRKDEEDDFFLKTRRKFRDFRIKSGKPVKLKEGKFIEKAKFAIETPGELKGITFKGLEALKKKKFKGITFKGLEAPKKKKFKGGF